MFHPAEVEHSIGLPGTTDMQEHDSHSLVKEVPGHLFRFEEKVFGVMTLTQFLCDLSAGVGILALTTSLPLTVRIAVGVLLALPVLLLVHGKVQDYSFVYWFYLMVRSLTLPRQTSWQSRPDQEAIPKKRKRERQSAPAIQTTWIPFDSLERGIASYSEDGNHKRGIGRYWVVFEVEGRTIRYLSEAEQVRVFERFESFFTGLEFRLQFLSLTSQVHLRDYVPLQAQKEALSHLRKTPCLVRLQQANLAFQQNQMQHYTMTRHFIIISVSSREEAFRRSQREQQHGMISSTFQFLFNRKRETISREQLLDQLRIHCSVIKKALQQLDIHARLLSDPEQLKLFASCLSLGAEIPSYLPEHHLHHPESTKRAVSLSKGRQIYVRGLHRTFLHQGNRLQFEKQGFSIADLVAPSQINIHPDRLEIEIRGRTRYLRYFTVVGYGHQLPCGWLEDLTALGLPLLLSIQFEPLDTRHMIHKLELHLVKLESKRIADQKSLRLTRADQNIEVEQVRRITRELAARRMKIFVVTMSIGIHASDPSRLEQRSHYLLSHLRDMQLRVRTCHRQHDQIWQASLPTCAPILLDQAVNLPSDVCSTFLHCSTGNIGTPTGVFLGWTSSGLSRRPVYFNPWSAEKSIPNPHVVVVGESGMGKSWLGKTFVTGLMGMGIADIIVLDRDDDYLPLHETLVGESQRYNLARSCPINFFDLPFGPTDVDPNDPADLLTEFLDNHLMLALALIVTDTESGHAKLSKIEEAYLTRVGRLAYEAHGITIEAIRTNPNTLLLPAPTLAEFIATMKQTPASSEEMRVSLIERLSKALYLFPGLTSISISKPLTVFSIRELDEKWYPLMTFVVQNFLYRHRSLRRDERYLAYVVEEASYMLKHPAGRRYLESGSRGFRKLGIAQITLSQHPRDFLEEGAVILSNAGTAFFLGMQRNAAEKLQLSSELERRLTEAVPGQAVMRCGNEYAAISIASQPHLRAVFTTDPRERRRLQKMKQQFHAEQNQIVRESVHQKGE